MRKYLILIVALISFAQLKGQQSSFEAVNLGENVNTSYPELNPVITHDGKTLFFVRANHPDNNFGKYESQDIWYSTRQEDGSWGEAQRMPEPLNSGRYNVIYSAFEDGEALLINGVYDNNNNWKRRGLSVVYHLGNNEWSYPEEVKIKAYKRKNRGDFSSAYINNEGDVMLLSYAKRYHKEKNNLYVTTKKKNGKWKKPKKLKRPVKSWKSENSPILSGDGNTLYFSSKRKKGKGSFDIYYSERIDDKYRKWTKPRLLSDTVNSGAWEAFYYLNKTGSFAYWASTNDSYGSSDIFSRKVFEEKPFVRISGIVKDKITDTIIDTGSKVTILLNGEEADSVQVDPETKAYSITVPLGQTYQIAAKIPHYKNEQYTVDVSEDQEYKEVEQNLYVEAQPYSLLKGQIVERNNRNFPAGINPEIHINGELADSVAIDSSGFYSFLVEHGKEHSIEVQAKDYKPVVTKLDLSDINEYQEIEEDLYINKVVPPAEKAVHKEPARAIVTGKIINQKTLKAIDSTIEITIRVDSLSSLDIDITGSTYFLELSPGKKYNLSASAESFYPKVEMIDLSAEEEVVKIYKDLYLAPLEVGSKVKLENIFFETGKAALKTESFEELNRVVQFMEKYPALKIEIGGHTDNVGNADLNRNLSHKRAEAVAEYITASGIPEDRIKSKGYGFDKPVATNDTKEGRAKNRRVEFTILEVD